MPAASKPSLVTLDDFFRFAVLRFKAARLAYGHGTTNAVDEAAFMMLEAMRLPIHTIAPWLDLKPTGGQRADGVWPIDPRKVRCVLDLCTGSGCLAILAALTFPRARVDAVDLSAGALALARRNLAAHRLGERL